MTINTKEGAILFDDAGENEEKYVGYKDMIVLADLLKQRFEEETEKEAVIYADGDRCEIYISNENIGMVFDILKEVRNIENDLLNKKSIDPDSVNYVPNWDDYDEFDF